MNYLENRYCAEGRLPPSTPFEALTPISEHQPYIGTIAIWDINTDTLEKRLFAFLRPTYKPQQAIWYRQKLWILGVDRLEVYSVSSDLIGNGKLVQLKEVIDPWLSGGHTIFPDGMGHLLISCAGSDSILYVDEDTYQVIHAIRLPESLYGHNYPLKRTDSIVDHYIENNMQLTHINCAYPWRGGVVVSTIIGSIGWFDTDENYHELIKGFVGSHGVRVNPKNDNLYFCDRCLGTIIFLTDHQQIQNRVAINSL